jgi:sodium-independent sulfate anion transporter 11
MSTQIPTALGISGIDTHEPPYKVLINTAKALPNTGLDAAIGLSCIAMLFIIRDLCSFMEKRQPRFKRTWSFVSSLRLTFAMLLYTLISYLVNRGLSAEEAKFRIVGHIDPGFQKIGIPQPTGKLLGAVLPQLPAVAIILIIEHIAIAKAMGRQFGYTIDPSQEIVALGSANLFSPFVGGYVCTGSFGASAVLSKAGVRTPLAGLFSALVLVLALYVLTAVFFYIPNAALAGLIIHAVCNLVTPPKNLHKYWLLSPLELLIWIIGVVLAIFESLETSIYVGIGLSLVLMLIRIARTKGQFMGRVKARRVEQKGCTPEEDVQDNDPRPTGEKVSLAGQRDVYLPLDRQDASNPLVQIDMPYPGVFLYRFNESFNYLNQARHIMLLLEHIMKHTKRRTEEHYEKESDRLWNDPGPKKHDDDEGLPYLRAVVLDFATLNNIDITSVQGLIDLRNTLDRHCAPDAVELHFSNVHNRWTRRALACAGFGCPSAKNSDAQGYWRSAYTIAAVLDEDQHTSSRPSRLPDEESAGKEAPMTHAGVLESSDTEVDRAVSSTKEAAVYGVDRPFFHVDLQAAVESAVRDAQRRDRRATTCNIARPGPCAGA